MVTVRRRGTTYLLLLMTLVGLPARATGAPITRGLRAPEIDARAVDEDTSVLLAALRGRCVLLEFFGADCPHCKRLVARMNAVHERYRSRGLTVLAVSPDAATSIARFRREQGVRHAIARVPMDTLRAYEVTKYPLGLLVAPDGRVLWRGEPDRLTDRVLEAYLARVRILPDVPQGFGHVAAALGTYSYGAVERDLDRLRTCHRLEQNDCAFVLATLAWIDWQRQQAWAHAAEDERRERWSMAHATYVDLEASYADTATARRAEAAAARLLQDPGRAREIRAAAALERARRAGRWQAEAYRLRLLRSVTAEHPGTHAAAEAAALIRSLP